MALKLKLGLLFCFGFLMFTIGLGSWGLTESSEGRYAEISKEMYRSGDYLHPTLMGIKHYHKPPLTYYVTTLGYAIFGVNEFGARFFLSVALTLLMVLVYKISLLMLRDHKKAFAAVVLFISFPSVLIASRFLTTDVYLLLFVTASIYYFILYKKHRKQLSLFLFYLAFALGFLTKGPAVLIPVVAFIVVWMFVNKQRHRVTVSGIIGLLIFLAIGTSWFIAVCIDNPKFLDYFINEQIVQRAVSADDLHRNKPIWYYLMLLPALGFPWLPMLLAHLFSNKGRWHQVRDNPSLKVLSICAVVVLVLFSLVSSKLISYILPIFPLLAIVGGHFIVEMEEKIRLRYINMYLFLFLFWLIALFVLDRLPNIEFPLSVSAILAASILFLIVAVLFYYGRQSAKSLMVLSFTFGVALLLTFTLLAGRNSLTIKSYRDVAAFIKEKKHGNLNSLIVYNLLIPSVQFYLDEKVITVAGMEDRVERETLFEDNSLYKRSLISLSSNEGLRRLKNKLKEKNQVFFMLQKDTLPKTLQNEIRNFRHREVMGKYLIYY